MPPDAEGHETIYIVGGLVYAYEATARITRITVQQDLPALHCNMRRVCVWSDDGLAFQAPMHAVRGVCYVMEGDAA